MAYSVGKIFLHPRLTARVMSDLEKNLENAVTASAEFEGKYAEKQAELNAAVSERERLQSENYKLREAVEALGRQMVEVRHHLDALEHENYRLRKQQEENLKELESRQDADTRISEFEKTLERVKDMKLRYEQRIQRLRAEIIRLRELTGEGNSEADEIKSIDMRDSRHDDDWLISIQNS